MDLITEYAILAQKCYKKAKHIDLPENWTSLLHYKGSYGNTYALYINEVRKEIVLGIKGTDNLFNYLSNAVLVAGRLTRGRFTPPGQDEIEGLVYHILEQEQQSSSIRGKGVVSDSLSIFSGARVSELGLASSVSSSLPAPNIQSVKTSGTQKWTPNCYHAIIDMGRAIEDLDNGLGPILLLKILSDLHLAAQALNIYDLSLESEDNPIGSNSLGAAVSTGNNLDIISYLKRNDPECFRKLKTDTNTLLENFQGFSLKIVGHSLGAVMAELCAVEFEVECIGFESPGSKEIIEKIKRYRLKTKYTINTYLSAPNIINTLYGHPGNSYRMFIPHTKNGLIALKGETHTTDSLWSMTTAIASAFCLWADKKWLSRQHSIKNIIIYLQNTQGEQIKKITKWPRLNDIVRHKLNEMPELFGNRNIDDEVMCEESIEKMPNYQVI